MNANLYVFSIGDPITITAHVWALDEEQAADHLASVFADHDNGNHPLPTSTFAEYRRGGDIPREPVPCVECILVWNYGQQIKSDDIAYIATEAEIDEADIDPEWLSRMSARQRIALRQGAA